MTDFQTTVLEYYAANGRSMPWRDTPTFYYVLVSEIMLQQTQVPRVLPKFQEFIAAFPTAESLAAAPLARVIEKWSGLGYNRRAKYLHEAAKAVVKQGAPRTLAELTALPGVGANTAAAIMNYAYNQPVPFVETNIRTAYFYHFFNGAFGIDDKTVLAKVAETMPKTDSRTWFWALMDYGTYLKQQGRGQLSASRHNKKQSAFQGSVRQMRGVIIAALTSGDCTDESLRQAVAADERYEQAKDGLIKDGLIMYADGHYHLTK